MNWTPVNITTGTKYPVVTDTEKAEMLSKDHFYRTKYRFEQTAEAVTEKPAAPKAPPAQPTQPQATRPIPAPTEAEKAG